MTWLAAAWQASNKLCWICRQSVAVASSRVLIGGRVSEDVGGMEIFTLPFDENCYFLD